MTWDINIKQPIQSCTKRIPKAIGSYHFWVIIFLIFIITTIYYSHIFFIHLLDPRWIWLWYLVVFEIKNHINGGLFLIVFFYAAFVFRWWENLAIWLFSIVLILPRIIFLTSSISLIVTNIILLLIPLMIVSSLCLLKRWRERERAIFLEREEEHRAYIAQVIQAQENERKRISREIHDDITQKLWILANDAQKQVTEKLRTTMPETAAELEKFKDILLHISDDTRRLSVALRPGILDDLGPILAIRWLVDQLDIENSIKANILVEGPERQLNNELSTQLFRIAQEALFNIRRHSEAKKVNVKLEFKPETVKMTIQDNGKGFESREIQKFYKEGKLGIIGINERVRMLDGISEINSKLGKGTSISVEFKC
jgi:signal transduction histidine kinase